MAAAPRWTPVEEGRSGGEGAGGWTEGSCKGGRGAGAPGASVRGRARRTGVAPVESAYGFQRRDRLLALFWPELDQAQTRQALRQSLYVLRRSLGDDVLINRGAEEVGIARGALQCDVCAFTDLLDQNRLEDALALYRGDFLAGCSVANV